MPGVKKAETVPFYRRYKKKDQELIYVVARLKSDAETQKLISEAIRKFEPELVLTKLPAENKFLQEKEFSACEQDNRCSTPVWTCRMARKKGIPCLTAEPYHTELLKEALKFHLTPEEILFYYTYRSLVGKKDPLEGLEQIIEENKKVLNLASNYNKYDFIRTYKGKMNRAAVQVDAENLEPLPNGNYLQSLSAIMKVAYYNSLFDNIDEQQTIHKRLMVVYDPATFSGQESALEEYYSGHIP
jgi:hypothetical protein